MLHHIKPTILAAEYFKHQALHVANRLFDLFVVVKKKKMLAATSVYIQACWYFLYQSTFTFY